MPANTIQGVPGYCRHKATGRAYVRINGRQVYLGPYGSAASKAEYRRVVAEVAAGGNLAVVRRGRGGSSDLNIVELIAAYWSHCNRYYLDVDGRPSDYTSTIQLALKPLRLLYGKTPVAEFGPLRLRAVQEQLVQKGHTRTGTNKLIGIIRRMFKWGVANELVPAGVWHALTTVEGLKRGRTAARESKPIMPVDDWVVEATLRHLPAVVADMVRVQRLTGMRPGEICSMRPCDVDRGADVWTYKPATHKTQHLGHERVVAVGPKAQAILAPYLLNRDREAFCFAPDDSEDLRHDAMRERRKSKVQPSQLNRRKRRPKRPPGARYVKETYVNAIRRAAQRADEAAKQEAAERGEPAAEGVRLVPHWSPNQLRHAAATEVRRQFGLEAAQVVLGHSTADVTQVYAERDMAKAVEVARLVG